MILKMLFSTALFIGLILGLAWYTPYRLSQLLGLTRRKPLFVAAALMAPLCPILMLSLGASSSPAFGVVGTAAGVFFGAYIYLTLALMAFHLIGLAIDIPGRLAVLCGTGMAVTLAAIGFWQAGSFMVTEVEIPIDRLKRDVTLMHISDIHIGHQRGRNYLERIVSETNRRKPDFTLINGDLVDSAIALEPGALEPLARFEAPVYFTTGNHESYVDTARALAIIASHGIRVLHNEVIETHGLRLVGLDYMNADENTFDMHSVNKLTIKEELAKIPIGEDKPVILMHHSPVGLKYVSARGIALMLSGHTHAGQMFPATIATQWLFPLNRGLHFRDGTFFFVSQGAGTFGPRMRIGSSNEINLVRLKARN